MDGDEPTQATQNVLDPRRVGKQNSGFSDDDVSDIICVLYPRSDPTRQEIQRLAQEGSPHIIGKDEADGVEPDYELEDHASRFESNPTSHGDYSIKLRLSAHVKNPAAGFAFGRNAARCDIVFVNDPLKRVSNVHFRIYVNEYGNVMIEDQSTNGTFVDTRLLSSKPKNGANPVTRWVLSSGCIIRVLLHDLNRDLTFLVRIPRRDDDYDRAYIAKVEEYFARHGLKTAPRTGGHVDLFKTPGDPVRKDKQAVMRREWTGSGTYNRIKKVGQGAFAVVYRVTSKYDGKPYAAKEIEKRRFMKNGVLDQKVENEMKIMRRVQHPNIVRYMENIDWEDRLLIIIMEFVPGGDLGKLVSDDGAFPEDMAQTMARQLLSALGYLHANNITHRDVKPDNILINTLDPLDVKLTDFGLSKMVDTEQTFLRTFCGTLLYCAPEVYTEYAEYDDNGVRSRVDIWSLGGVLFFTLTGSPPYPVKSGISHSELLHKIMTTMLNISPLERYQVAEQGIDFLHRLLQRRPENRATIPELESHAWLGGPGSVIEASQSYDVITDDEDVEIEPSQFHPAAYDDDRISDSEGDESEKENDFVTQRPPPPRLFGEVGVSAVGSSGALPADLLRIPAEMSMGETEILDSHQNQEYDSEDSTTIGGKNGQAYVYNQTSIYPNQSTDQLQSLVEDVASQSLGGKESKTESPAISFNSLSQSSMDPNSSKRKPSSHEVSDEFDENTPPGKPTLKRLKSDGDDDVTEDVVREFKLLARIPQIKRLGSGRQIDGPVNKITFWEQDRTTWHLQYPEMTQLHLGPSNQNGATALPGAPGLRPGDRNAADDTLDIPSTAAPIVVPVQVDPTSSRAIAVVESLPESCIQGISFPITDSLASFGRGPENTEVFKERLEPRVPKCAFKIMLWKEGYDPSKDPSKMKHPWQTTSSADDETYHFWISTKATLGIRINGYTLASSDAKHPNAPSHYWTRINDGDSLMIWGGQDPTNQTKLIFRCFWGGSSKPRAEHRPQLELASPAIAQKLDAACHKTEKRMREAAERRRRLREAEAEHQARLRQVQRERERSYAFEKRRLEAVEYLAAGQRPGSRRASPGYLPPMAQASRLQGNVLAARLSR
ncbi:kinase [Hirsutella rhossiliensis]|uniref:Autophagy-related protein 1 n=1 Tax=Hirsutella rhossiliensis TaxID=111463 RepID=A0A9P8N280_9HYPO|nr:kinase [Hirsutella rhossiliensis]KAH0963372.1 kinase [Hirsutella rhossiliensis]